MSIEAMSRVWNKSQQQGTKLVLLLALADMTNSDGYCWPSLETLQERARLSRYQNVIKAIAEIEADAEVWVDRSRGRNHSNTYIVTSGMSSDELANILITRFDYSPDEATQKASDFIKRSPQTTLLKCSPEDINVVDELHLSEQNVVVEVVKCSPQTTRTIIEPNTLSNDKAIASSDASPPTFDVGKKKKKKSNAGREKDPERDEWFNVVCWMVFAHQDRKLLNKEDFININNTINTIRDSTEQYTIDELKRWYKEIWSTEWPGKQRDSSKVQHPAFKDIKTGIGRVRATITPIGLTVSTNGSSPRTRMKEL
jgi:hypothetical protein